MASITSQLIVSLLDQVTGPARRVANSLRGITRTVKEVASGTIGMSERLDAAITRNNRAMDAADFASISEVLGGFLPRGPA